MVVTALEMKLRPLFMLTCRVAVLTKVKGHIFIYYIGYKNWDQGLMLNYENQ